MTHQNTLYDVFRNAAHRHADRPFLAVPTRLVSDWAHPRELSYAATLERVEGMREQYAQRGVRAGDRVALAFESRPQYFVHYLALNALGACVVPLNTDLTVAELAYQIGHARCGAVICLSGLREQLLRAIAETGLPIPLSVDGPDQLADIWRADLESPPSNPIERAAAILYTSGTTGKPKGCVLSNLYMQESARYNASLSGDVAIAEGEERMLNPLPLYHMNSMVSTAGAAMLKGACFVLPGRFSGTHWWSDVVDTGATRFNYLGIMIPALLAQPEGATEKQHRVRFAFGAGVEPAAHQRFEERFGISLMEVWGMTETGRFLIVDREPRHIDTRACGRPLKGLEARIANDQGQSLPDGVVGELVVRHTEANPRYGFFDGYLDNPAATETAWEGGWFHSGDLCTRSADGMFTFVDRKKNIVRRSGENISSAEVEAALAECSEVAQVTVLAVPDALRDEEVMACVVLTKDQQPGPDTARRLFDAASERLAYFKTPGWILFLEKLPVTGTQKVQKHLIFPNGFEPDAPGVHDLRAFKKWKK